VRLALRAARGFALNQDMGLAWPKGNAGLFLWHLGVRVDVGQSRKRVALFQSLSRKANKLSAISSRKSP
jgi:hypothetical protein